jgi:hypothetical protein
MDLPPPRHLVADILAEGLNLLAGRPKQGKSWWVLALAVALARGGEFFGRAVKRCPVLLLALEDNPRRLKSRLKKLLPGGEWPDGLRIETAWKRIDEGGLEDLDRWLAAHPGGVVLVDTLPKLRPLAAGRRADKYEEDYQAAGKLAELAGRHGAAVVAVVHTRKAAAEDVFDEIGGSLGLTGGADAALVLHRPRGGAEGTLYVTGRDVEERAFEVRFDKESCQWSLVGDATFDRQSGTDRPNKVQQCAQFLGELLGEFAYPSDEILTTAKSRGFTLDNVKEAKKLLKDKGLVNEPSGQGGKWWSGFGPSSQWKRRPESPHSPASPESGRVPDRPGCGETRESGETQESAPENDCAGSARQ